MSLVASATEMLYLGKYQGIPVVYIPGVYLGYTQGILGVYQHTWVFSLWVAMSLVASATEMLESCPTQANLLPSAEKLTEWTQPPPWKSKNHIITQPPLKSLYNFVCLFLQQLVFILKMTLVTPARSHYISRLKSCLFLQQLVFILKMTLVTPARSHYISRLKS